MSAKAAQVRLDAAKAAAKPAVVEATVVSVKRELMIEEIRNILEKFDRETTEALMAHGEKIQAIKHVRQRTGASLYSAKRFVEQYKALYSCHTLDPLLERGSYDGR